MYYPSGFFKTKARDALKGHWQTALLIALIVNLPSLLAQGISVFTGNDPATLVRVGSVSLPSRAGVELLLSSETAGGAVSE